MLHFLRGNDGSTPGTAISSDNEGNGNESEGDYRIDDDNEEDKDDDISINFAFPSLQRSGGQPRTQQDGRLWATNMACAPS